MKKLFFYLALCVPVLFLSACGDDDDAPVDSGDFYTAKCDNIGSFTATAYGYVDLQKLNDVSEIGIVYGTENSLDTENGTFVKSTNVDGDNMMKANLNTLRADFTYYYAVYVRQTNGVYRYGKVKSFTTAVAPEFVDLALPSTVLWASKNLGASSPEEYGGFYAWAETQPKYSFYPSNNAYADNNINYTKYNYKDGINELETSDDAVYVYYGKKPGYYIPSVILFKELIDNTNKADVFQKGVKGLLLTSKKNGNSIFIPYAGYRTGDEMKGSGERLGLWSRDLDESQNFYATVFDYWSGAQNINMLPQYRYLGYSVRAIKF